jgi:hypothetical protein
MKLCSGGKLKTFDPGGQAGQGLVLPQTVQLPQRRRRRLVLGQASPKPTERPEGFHPELLGEEIRVTPPAFVRPVAVRPGPGRQRPTPALAVGAGRRPTGGRTVKHRVAGGVHGRARRARPAAVIVVIRPFRRRCQSAQPPGARPFSPPIKSIGQRPVIIARAGPGGFFFGGGQGPSPTRPRPVPGPARPRPPTGRSTPGGNRGGIGRRSCVRKRGPRAGCPRPPPRAASSRDGPRPPCPETNRCPRTGSAVPGIGGRS